MNDFDRDPEALAWARAKVQRHIDKARRWSDQAAASGNGEQSAGWRRIANHMQRTLHCPGEDRLTAIARETGVEIETGQYTPGADQ